MKSSSPARSWPMMRNRFLIGIGVLAFGFFITGKALKALKGDDASAAVKSASETDISAEKTLVLISKDIDLSENARDFSELEVLIGNKVVFVSASEPAFIVTDDERRLEVGDIPGTDVELSNISSTQLVLRQADELMVFALSNGSAN